MSQVWNADDSAFIFQEIGNRSKSEMGQDKQDIPTCVPCCWFGSSRARSGGWDCMSLHLGSARSSEHLNYQACATFFISAEVEGRNELLLHSASRRVKTADKPSSSGGGDVD